MHLELKNILKLSVAERILMVEKIWDSITPENIEISDAQKTELDSRLLKHKNNQTSYSSWNAIKDDLKNR
tara:strand:+ start:789 stop:998 length:210 start_codon:yes stop_codon:yes gene_type:complete